MTVRNLDFLTVRQKPGSDRSAGLLQFEHNTIDCKLGKNGITAFKQEGDSSTPIGEFRLLYGWFRRDKILSPKSLLPFREINPNHGWCDEANHPSYNQPVKLPFRYSHEKMMREDSLYDVCIVLDYNIFKKMRNKGSAIFFHLTTDTSKGTEGCVAIDLEKMMMLLPRLSDKTVMKIIG